MHNNLLRKMLIIGTIVLFAGSIIVPSISSVNNQVKLENTSTQGTPFNPFLNGWWSRKKITIDHTMVAGDLNDFPVLISIIDSDLVGKTQEDGDDILFMDDKGKANQLCHEIEHFDSSIGELIAWVKLPFVSSSSNTVFYMYYKNRKCDSQQDIEGTWNDDYLAVYHMNDAGHGILDSTSNNRDGYEIGNPSYQQHGVLTKSAIKFDGVNDGFDIPNDFGLYQQDFTVECWAKFDQYPTTKQAQLIIFTGEISAHLCYRTASDAIDWEVRFIGEYYWDSIHIVNHPTDITNFHHYTATVNHNNKDSGFYDGDFIGSMNNYGIDTHIYDSVIGLRMNTNDCYFNGLIDEVRISNSARSIEWINTTYNNMNNPSGFFTYSHVKTKQKVYDNLLFHWFLERFPLLVRLLTLLR